MPAKRFGMVDLYTGEVFGAFIIPIRSKIGGKWVRVFQDTLKALRDKKLHGQTFWILLNLISEADFQNRVPGTTALAKILGMKQPNVSRAYRELKQASMLLVQDRNYYLSPLLCWKGNQKQLEKAYEELLSPIVLKLK